MSETPPPTSEDTPDGDITRRHFIEHVGFMSGTALLYAACKPSEPKKSEATVGPVVETSHRSLFDHADQTMDQTQQLVKAIRENPRKYLVIHLKLF